MVFGPVSRRRFLWAAAALLSGCGTEPPPPANPAPQPSSPPSKASSPRKVIIVGAGITGMAAAFDLIAKGMDVQLLEATNRPGGRILTLRSCFPESLYAEAGATYVVPDPHLLKLMKDMGVQLAPRKPRAKGLSSVYLRGDKRIAVPAGAEPPEEYPLSPEEKALEEPFGPMKKYFSITKGIDPLLVMPPELLPYDDMSAAEFLKKQGASQGYMDLVRDSFAHERSLERMSAMYLIRELGNIMREFVMTEPGGRILGGSDKLPQAMAERLGAKIVYKAEVKRIEQTAGGVRVRFVRNGENASIEGDRVISTLPSTVLRDIEIEPAFPEDKQRALKELTMASVTRIWATSKERFWLAKGESGTVESDAPLGAVRDETELQEGKAGVLGMYVIGDESRKLCAMDGGARINAALAYMNKAHPGLDGMAVGEKAERCWDKDPYAKGAYAHFSPGQMKALLPALMRVEGRMHFAGDQMSHRPGFMHGALASARRVVEEILK